MTKKLKFADLIVAPRLIAAEFAGEDRGDFGGRLRRASSVEEERAGAASEDVFDGSGEFKPSRESDLEEAIREPRDDRIGERGIFGDESIDRRAVLVAVRAFESDAPRIVAGLIA